MCKVHTHYYIIFDLFISHVRSKFNTLINILNGSIYCIEVEYDEKVNFCMRSNYFLVFIEKHEKNENIYYTQK